MSEMTQRLPVAGGAGSFHAMSTLAEIEAAIAQLPPAEWTQIRTWMDVHAPRGATTNPASLSPRGRQTPDFLARQKALFGDRVLSDSQTLLDELRADRF